MATTGHDAAGAVTASRGAGPVLPRTDGLMILLLVLAGVALFFGAPRSGEFYWSESPRNALNGAFVLDYLRALPPRPMEWAWQYYRQYPALTIGFYPPGLHVVLAAFFWLFGIGHAAAVACMTLFAVALGAAVYAIARRFAEPLPALAAALLLLGMPEIVIWTQQIMLDVPMLALAAWAAFFLLRYLDTGRASHLAAAVGLTVGAFYMKQTAFIPAAAMLIALFVVKGRAVLMRPHVWVLAGLGAVCLIPLVLLQLKFGSFNVESVVHRADTGVPRFSLDGLTWYPRHLPVMAGWLSVAGLICAPLALWKLRQAGRWQPAYTLLIAWFAVASVVLLLIYLKETRHGAVLLPPLAMLAVVPLAAWLPSRSRIIAVAAATACGAWLIATLLQFPTPTVHGIRQAAERIVALAGPGSRIAFFGREDGSFVFNVRELDRDRSMTVVRVDKLLLNVRVIAELGLNARNLTEQEIAATFNRLGISYVAAEPELWTHEPVVGRLMRVLRSDQFEQVDRIAVSGSTSTREVLLFRNRGPLKQPPDEVQVSSSLVR